jgi:hypothetical protein
VDVLCSESPGDDFVDALIKGDKRRAAVCLEAVSVRDYSKVIGTLDSRLEVLAKLSSALRSKKTIRDISIDKTVPVFLARAYLPSAKYYDREKRAHCRRVLAAVDDGLRSGVRDGVLESICALW